MVPVARSISTMPSSSLIVSSSNASTTEKSTVTATVAEGVPTPSAPSTPESEPSTPDARAFVSPASPDRAATAPSSAVSVDCTEVTRLPTSGESTSRSSPAIA